MIYGLTDIHQILLRRMCCCRVLKAELKSTNSSLTVVFKASQNNVYSGSQQHQCHDCLYRKTDKSCRSFMFDFSFHIINISRHFITIEVRTTGLYLGLFVKRNNDYSFPDRLNCMWINILLKDTPQAGVSSSAHTVSSGGDLKHQFPCWCSFFEKLLWLPCD